MNNILVTGGAGFIGSHLSERLLSEKKRVIILDNFNGYYNPAIKERNVQELEAKYDNVTCIKADIRDIGCLKDIFRAGGFDGVVHLAAAAGVRPSIADPVLYTNVNINGTLNILECMRERNIKKLIFASSSSVYGNNEKVPFSESDMVDNPISPYAATKKAGELLCHTYHALFGINVACLRFFTVYGPRQRPDLAIHKFTELILKEEEVPFYGDGTTRRDYTYIEDIIDGICRALDWVNCGEKKYNVFNLGESRTITLSQMVETIEKCTGIKAKRRYMPLQPGDVERTCADITKAKNILGYNPKKEFEAGISDFINWYKSRER